MEDWNNFINDRMETLYREYLATKEGQHRREAEENMDQLLTTCLTKTDRSFAEEVLGKIYLQAEEDSKRLYQQGMMDCVTILKTLGVMG